MTGVTLTKRDREVLRFLASKRAAPLDVLAQRFFAKDPRSGRPSKSPLRACLRRLSTLRHAGHLVFESLPGPVVHEVRPALVYLSKEEARRAGVRVRQLHPRHRNHQVQTMRACEQMEKSLLRRGMKLAGYRLESELLAEAYGGALVKDGAVYDSFPDALLTLEHADGKQVELALEYVTKAYTDAQIVEKARTLPSNTAWCADTKQTAARVFRLTGAPCHVV